MLRSILNFSECPYGDLCNDDWRMSPQMYEEKTIVGAGYGYVITTYGGSEVIIETEISTPQKNNLPPPTPAVFVRRNALLVCD